ncbi:GBS Bsp-like repeat-containing protein [Streptococcus cristatus]|uniref:GBS Bsp-like repeat-containing protein n=1 Tax=Streptococcus cristatus TaxID=45634 RepID=UPI0005605520|nr:GBS Bsp-like repeat-containing protein [Streptococcus cristatus]KJQ59760.1 N-acetylmuramoyl-L-alanine amidase [Streptococcus cristatus]SQG32589.1 putative N-acetylmuramidase/lysin [Streptococcus cristatus ATCC 51100]
MKSKELIYLASTAILLAATANVVQAEENTPTTTAPEVAKAELQVEKDHQPQQVSLPEAVSTDRQVKQESSAEKSEASTVYKAPENLAPAASLVKENVPENKASEQAKIATSEAIQNPVKAEQTSPAISASPASKKGSTSFYNAASLSGQTARGNSQAEIKGSTFVDVSSHNGHISVEDYRQLASKGVGGVVVKLTEGTHYTNPFAESQVRNAQAAGLQVSTYAFSHYTNDAEARAEARYYAAFANKLSLPKNTVMVNDMEDPKMQTGINQHTQAWADEMRKQGYANLMYYTSASWVDQNNLRHKGSINTSLFGLDNFWIAQYPAPKLSANDAKSLKYNSRAGAWQFTSQAQLLSGKHVFDQSIDYSGRFTARATLVKQPLTGKISIQNNNPKTGTFDVVVSEVSAPHGVQEVKLPTWSSERGQDDIVWYTATKQANGTYKLTVNSANHKGSMGEYNVHLYYVQGDGKLVGVGGTTTKVSLASVAKPEGKLTIANNNPKTGTFDVIVSEVSSPQGVREVLLPTWSNEQGQDDIIWHKAQKQSDGTYKFTVRASEHKNSVGDYSVHLYYIQNDGKLVGVGGTTTKVSVAKPEGKLTIANNDPKTGTFDVIVSEVSSPQGVREVLLPTWSNDQGQDDIIWHKAQKQSDGTYKFTVRSSEHKNSVGDYSVHLYYVQGDGKLVGVGGTTTKVSVAKPEGKLTIANNNPKTGTFDVIVSEVSSPQGVREVLLPTWSHEQDQDDIIWHKAQRQSDGTYKFTVRSSEHKNSVGDYSVHLYYIQNDGKMVGVGGTTTKVSLASVAKPEGKLTIANNDPKTGTFDVIVSEVSSPQGVREVLLPTWSNEQGQDDIIWHKAQKQSDGTYKFTVRASEHKNSVGDYSVHLYYVQNDGKLVGVGGTTTKVSIAIGEKPQGKISIQNKNNETGEFDIVVSGVVAPEGVKEVYLPTWSSENGQDDIQWYTAERQADGTYRKHVYARDHKNSQGEYNVHLYYLNNRNQLQGAGGEKTTVSIKHPQSPSSQRDRVLAAAAAMVGVKGGSAEHHRLVNDYNSVRPLPVGYAVKNSDDWCDIFTTVIFQREGLSDLIGRECGVERHIHIFKRLGIWNEDGNSTPKAGDIITFNWDQNSQQNDGWADHIGIVEKVENGIIHTIEGNSNNEVKRNTYRIGHGNIRGFATPRYK